MKIGDNSLGCATALKLTPVLLCLLILSAPIQSYALNEEMVEGERHWIDQEVRINYQEHSYFNGFAKYIIDSDEGCFYFFISFLDSRIDSRSNDNITLAFTITNQEHAYSFHVNQNGVLDNTTPETLKAIDVSYNFDETSCKRQGGNIYVAFELKNSDDKKLDNTISCEYYCGFNCTYNLMENISLDMSSQQADKTTTKKSSSDKSAKNSDSGDSNSADNDSQDNQVTKFSGSGYAASEENNQDKFSPGDSEDEAENQQWAADGVAEDDSTGNTLSSEGKSAIGNSRAQMSDLSKILIAVFAVLFTTGAACIIAGIVNGKKMPAETKQSETTPKDN